MTTATAGVLVVLALVDSTSFGTLLIPVWLLLTPGPVRVGRVLLFLGTVAGFYLMLGLALVTGARALLDGLVAVLDNSIASRLQLVLGVALLVGSFFVGRRGEGPVHAGRLLRLRQRAMSAEAESGLAGLVTLALVAAVLEVATMLPYLAATGIIGSSGHAPHARVAVLAGYCLVMILPALVLLGGRMAARRALEPFLERIAHWMERNGAETTAWIVGIVGFVIAGDALARMPDVLSVAESVPR